ncbi:hypothetical protein B9Z55_021719 [Caenorhabditis nigoni]|uniref:Uncharacterized protein n=1 Tax=Caenorhabditis nigoni TaxID=1611254 RepID=A0A2G5TTC4_9PELO|nr:hypothetical protein B9Z55_021719 [Caenorhabditis nigoni]
MKTLKILLLENSVAPQRQHDEKTKKSEPGSHERLERRKKTWKVAPSEPKAREKRIWRRRCTKRSKRNICSSSRAETFLEFSLRKQARRKKFTVPTPPIVKYLPQKDHEETSNQAVINEQNQFYNRDQ